MRIIVSFLCLVFLGVLPAQANEAQIRSFVTGIADKAVDVIESSASEAEKQARLEGIFKDTVAIDWIGKFVLGKYWRQASESQRAEYLKNYEKFLISRYTSRFTSYSGQSLKVKSISEEDDGEFYVQSHITGGETGDIPVDYRIRKDGNGYKIHDIVIEGVSLITTQRSEFSSVANRKGLDGLIGLLGKKA